MSSPTSIETALYESLEQLGISYVAQHAIPKAGTVVDAFLPAGRIVLYADGDYWHSLPKTSARDKRQDERLLELGYTVHRLKEKDLRRNPVEVVRRALRM